MKILVFSDSHGNTERMISAIADHLPAVDLVIHLGDLERDIDYVRGIYPELPVVSVTGNCDSYARSRRILELMGLRILCIHGHTYGVKDDIETAAQIAAEENADILLYGHTHATDDRLMTVTLPFGGGERAVRVFNPGSIGKGWPPTYGIINIPKNGSYLTSHAEY